MKWTRLVTAALLAAAPLTACDCSEDPLTRVVPMEEVPIVLDAGIWPDAAAPDATAPDAEPHDAGPEARTLRFDGTSPVRLFFGASIDLRFILETVSGAPVPGESIQLTFAGTGGALGASSVVTDPSGAGAVRFLAGATPGSGTLTATAELAPPVTVAIEVGEDPEADLTLEVISAARIAVAEADALVYIGPPGATPTCAQLFVSGMPPAPTFSASFTSLPGSSAFANQTSGALVTAFATGTNAAGVVVARGCTEGVRLSGGINTRVLVTLDQLPPRIDGDYDALLMLDVGATLPPPIGPTIVLITDFLSDPAGWVLYQTLVEIDAQLGTNFVTWTPPGGSAPRVATFAEVRANQASFPTWRAARNALHNFLVSTLGQVYVDVTTVGGDIAHAVRSFEVGAGYTVTSTGTLGRVSIEESWKALVFQWQLGCPPGDLGCARHAVELSGARAHLAPAAATYGASVVYAPAPGAPERYQLVLDAHEIRIRYGAIVLLLLEEIVFPNIPGVGGPNLTAVLNNIVGCADVALQLEIATGIPAVFFEGVCVSAVGAAATYIENQILALDSSNNPGLIAGLSPSGGGEMILVDGDHDLATELVDEVTTYASWTTGQGVTTPITGDGRRRAARCGVDADCTGGLVCAPIGSYLKVRALENDCRRPTGAMPGVATCTQDSDCETGLCFDAGGGNRVCFSACTQGSCAMGTCAAGAATVNLDPILVGLGGAGASACVP